MIYFSHPLYKTLPKYLLNKITFSQRYLTNNGITIKICGIVSDVCMECVNKDSSQFVPKILSRTSRVLFLGTSFNIQTDSITYSNLTIKLPHHFQQYQNLCFYKFLN